MMVQDFLLIVFRVVLKKVIEILSCPQCFSEHNFVAVKLENLSDIINRFDPLIIMQEGQLRSMLFLLKVFEGTGWWAVLDRIGLASPVLCSKKAGANKNNKSLSHSQILSCTDLHI